MTQQNIAYNWNIITMSTLTHALLLVAPRVDGAVNSVEALDRVYRPIDRLYQYRVYPDRVCLDRLYFDRVYLHPESV